MLRRNVDCAYLKQWGNPATQETFRRQVPLTDYEQLQPWIGRIAKGETTLLFPGRPAAFEKTGGSSGGQKLIPYTQEGLDDFRSVLLPWLNRVVMRHQVTGSAYFSLSPACREKEQLAGIPVGLSDIAYVGEQAAAIFAEVCAVPPSVGELTGYDEWRAQTLKFLKQSPDLELISAWSPTFLLKLFEGQKTEALWPRLKIISCWAAGSSAEFAESLRKLFPQAVIEPKGLMSTEAAITVPDENGLPVLADYGFFEFRRNSQVVLEKQLELSEEYEVIVTTASGLYRYCTGDRVKFLGRNHKGKAILDFIGRQGLASDLVGEKLSESFVASCLKELAGERMLVPNINGDGYTLVIDREFNKPDIGPFVEKKLMSNPQYAYARKFGQLKALEVLPLHRPWAHYERYLIAQGTRVGDVKPVALRAERHWITLFNGHQ